MYVILLLQFYCCLTSAFRIGDFYRGCGVCPLVVVPYIWMLNFLSIFMVDISQARHWTAVLTIAKRAVLINTSLQAIVDVQKYVNDSYHLCTVLI